MYGRDELKNLAKRDKLELGQTTSAESHQIAREQMKENIEGIIDYLSLDQEEELRAIKICRQYFYDSFIIIDNNIFMNKDAQWFFDLFRAFNKSTGRKLLMFSVQYDELVNLKNNTKKRRNEEETETHEKTIHALKLIEDMVEENSLNFLGMNKRISVDDERYTAYADGYWLYRMYKKPGQKYSLITDDRDLRIRARASFQYNELEVTDLAGCDYRIG